MEFNLEQAKNLLAMFGETETTVTVIKDGDTLVAYETEYPEEGSVEL